jgi:hypothetical protein
MTFVSNRMGGKSGKQPYFGRAICIYLAILTSYTVLLSRSAAPAHTIRRPLAFLRPLTLGKYRHELIVGVSET